MSPNYLKFMEDNNLKQIELANYLGIGASFMSRIVNGGAVLTKEKYDGLLNNDKGWDTSALESDGTVDVKGWLKAKKNSVCPSNDALEKEVEMLREQVEELKAEKEKYWDMILKLMNK